MQTFEAFEQLFLQILHHPIFDLISVLHPGDFGGFNGIERALVLLLH